MKPIKILIVEDELIAAESLALDLKKLGYEVSAIANTAQKAIAKTQELKPDLILMDIMLKGEADGISAAQTVHDRFGTPVVYLTAYGDRNTLERAQPTCAYGYLVKPYKIDDLRSILAISLAKYREDRRIQENLARQQRLNQIKTHALAAASHDLRTPLTNILGYTELIRDYGDVLSPEKKQKYYNFIQSAIGEMNDSLEDLLLISAAEEDRLNLSPESFDLVAFFHSLVEEYSCLSEIHQFYFCSNSTSFTAFLDKKLLTHIANNLLSNAVKYSPAGGDIRVELSCEGQQIIFSVEDRGIGIPKNYRDRLFQLFTRADNVGAIKGNGLGLSIVKTAVALHGGTISLVSEENKGSKFTVTIPRRSNLTS